MKFIYWVESVVDWFIDMAFDSSEVTPFADPDTSTDNDTSTDVYPLFEPTPEHVIGDESNYHEMMLTGNARQRAEATLAYNTADDD